MNQNDIIYNLSDYLNDLKDNKQIDKKDLENKLKSVYNNQIVPYYESCTKADRNNLIIEYLLIKINDLFSANYKQSLNNLFGITYEHSKHHLYLKIEISYLTNMIKNKDGDDSGDGGCENDISFIQNMAKCLCLIDDLNINDLNDDLKVKTLILIKNIIKLIIKPSSKLNYDELVSIISKILSKFDSFLNHEKIYMFNKYLKIIDLIIENHQRIDQLNQLVENFIDYSVNNSNNLIQSIKTNCDFNKTSIEHTIYNNLYIKIFITNLKSLKVIKNDQLFKKIYELVDDEQIDLIYNQGLDDDQIVNFNLYFLEFQSNKLNNDKLEMLFDSKLNVHRLFFKLVSSVSFDYQILIEWLISNETNFLKYLVKYLKIFLNELVSGDDESNNSARILHNKCLNSSELNQIINLFQQLNIKINSMKKSFPYNCQPLLKLLNKV